MIGQTINGARLWVQVGPFQFQPGELAKIALIVFLAGYLREKREVLAQGRLKDFGPLLLIWGAAMLVLVVTNDLGFALLCFGIFLAMLYVATGRRHSSRVGLALFAPARRGYQTSTTSTTGSRSGSTRGPTSRSSARSTGELALRQDCGYQLVQSIYSIATAALRHGLGKGTFTTTAGDRSSRSSTPTSSTRCSRRSSG